MASPIRLAAIYRELESALDEYREAKEQFVAARVRYQSAKEKFAGIRKLAADMLPRKDWLDWQDKHPAVEFMGMPIGDAIVGALINKAIETASDAVQNKTEFRPHMFIDEIVAALEQGGFEFRGLTPRREINAALLKLDGVTKWKGAYKATEADEIFRKFETYSEEPEGEKAADASV